MICKCCDKDKVLDLFPFDKRSNIHRTTCKSCRNAKIRADRAENPDKYRKYDKSRYQNNKDDDNYGDWELDHIIPLSSFDLTDRSQIKQACHYKNFQPLLAKDNRAKSNKESYNVTG